MAVKLHDTYIHHGVICVWPDFGQVKGIEGISLSFSFRHPLHLEAPLGEVAVLDGFEKVMLRGFAVLTNPSFPFGVGPGLDPLHGFYVELNPEMLIFGIDKAVSVPAISVDVAVSLG